MAKSTLNPTKEGKPVKPKKDPTRINDEALRKLRALSMIQQRVAAISITQIAENFNVHPDTVDSELKWAKKHGLLETLEQRLLGNLANKSLVVIDGHLDLGNLDAAKEVLKFITHASQQKARREEKAEKREFDLDDYLREKRKGAIDVSSSPVAPSEIAEGTLLQGGPAGAPAGIAALLASPRSPGPGEDPGLAHDPADHRAGPADAGRDGAPGDAG
jgi:hypothetical protein